jgi:CHASE2 domain-containing sensor protein
VRVLDAQRDAVVEAALLWGPVAVVLIAGAFAARIAWWWPVISAALVFVLFAGTGFGLSARAARR